MEIQICRRLPNHMRALQPLTKFMELALGDVEFLNLHARLKKFRFSPSLICTILGSFTMPREIPEWLKLTTRIDQISTIHQQRRDLPYHDVNNYNNTISRTLTPKLNDVLRMPLILPVLL